MDIILNVLAIVVAVMALLITIAKFLEVNNATKKNKQLLDEFLTSDEPGESCLNFVYDGYLKTLKVKTNSKDFPDNDHLSKFIRYSNEDVRASMKRISETYEKFVL